MPPTVPFLEFAVAWSDENLQEVVLSASSEFFSGQVDFYGGPNALEGVARLLQGFPTSLTDSREIHLGQEDLSGYGTAKIFAYVTDATGHVAIEVTLRSCSASRSKRQESAVVVIPLVAGDLDRFVDELRRANNQPGACAVLRSTA